MDTSSVFVKPKDLKLFDIPLKHKQSLNPPELLAWAQEYRKTPVEKVRQLRSPAFNALGYRDYIKTQEAALVAGLI